MKHSSVLAVTDSAGHARNLIQAILADGFVGQEISAIFSDHESGKNFAKEMHTQPPHPVREGVEAGSFVGAVIGWVLGVGILAIPGIGPFAGFGPMLGALGIAGVGAAGGAIVGAFMGIGVPDPNASRYEGLIRSGHILLSVNASDQTEADRVIRIFKQGGATEILYTESVHTASPTGPSVPPGTTGPS